MGGLYYIKTTPTKEGERGTALILSAECISCARRMTKRATAAAATTAIAGDVDGSAFIKEIVTVARKSCWF